MGWGVCATLLQCSPVFVALGLLAVLSVVIAVAGGGWGLATLTVDLAIGVAACLVAPFALHETMHLVVLRWGCPGVCGVRTEMTLLRMSITPAGSLTTVQAIGVALAGPGSCVLVGGLLLAVRAPEWAAVAWLAHLIFLIPPMGDGRSLVAALKTRRQSRLPRADSCG